MAFSIYFVYVWVSLYSFLRSCVLLVSNGKSRAMPRHTNLPRQVACETFAPLARCDIDLPSNRPHTFYPSSSLLLFHLYFFPF